MEPFVCVDCAASIPRRFLHTAEFRPVAMFRAGEVWRSVPESHFVVSIYDPKGNEIKVKATCKPLEYVEDSEILNVILSGRK